MGRARMIELHRIGHTHEPMMINPNLIVTLEAHPDTTLSLATGAKIVVAEEPERVVELIDAWHAKIARNALEVPRRASREGPTPLRPR